VVVGCDIVWLVIIIYIGNSLSEDLFNIYTLNKYYNS